MRKYKTLAAIAYGGRVEKGEILELPEEVAQAFGPEYVQPLEEAVTSDTDNTDEVAIEDMSGAELKAKAKELGLPQSGSKADLVERIKLALEAQTATEETEEEETEETEGEPEVTEETETAATE